MRKPKDAKTHGFAGYQVIADGIGSLLIFAWSARAAERVARRILGEEFQPFEGSLEIRKEAGIGLPSEKDT